MKNYIVTYSNIARKSMLSLSYDYEQVQANTAIEAARKYVNDSTKTIKRSGSRYVDLCLVQGTLHNNTIHYIGNKIWYEVR